MMDVCFQCGIYRPDKTIDPQGPYAICPVCQYPHPLRQLPLLLISGASGTGKTTILAQLSGRTSGAVLLEGDILWRPAFNRPEKHRDFFETWLRLAKNITQSGQPVVIFNAGMGVPENIESCIERRYFSQIHYLALVCKDTLLCDRLKERPEWRESSGEDFIQSQIGFNGWFLAQAAHQEPQISLIDTGQMSLEKTAEKVAGWIGHHLPGFHFTPVV